MITNVEYISTKKKSNYIIKNSYFTLIKNWLCEIKIINVQQEKEKILE